MILFFTMKKDMIKNTIYLVLITCMLCLNSCINTPQDVVEQYEYQGPLDFASYYAELFPDDSLWIDTIRDSIINRVAKLPFKDILEFGDIIKNTKSYVYMSSIKISRDTVMNYFHKSDYKDGILLYSKYSCRHSIIDSVFTDSIFPVLLKAPYPILRFSYYNITDISKKQQLADNMKTDRQQYLNNIREDLEICKLNAIQAYDEVIEPMLKLAIDSLSSEDTKTLKKRLTGFSFKHIKEYFTFLDKEKFRNKWKEVVKGDNYSRLCSDHVNSSIYAVYDFQRKYYKEMVAKDWSSNYPSISVIPLKFAVPDISEDQLTKYIIRKNMEGQTDGIQLGPLSAAAQTIGSIIMLGIDIVEVATDEMSPEELLLSYIHQTIINSIPNDYFLALREQYISKVNKSYDKLYFAIENEL